MKKILLPLLCAVLCQAPLYAQITIDSGSYTAVFAGTIDSVSIANGSLPVLATGANIYTDLSAITYTVIDTPYVMHNAGPFGYLYADYMHHYISGTAPYYFNSRPYFNITNSSFLQYGETIDGKAYSIAQIPGAYGTDSLVFPPQTDVYTSPCVKVQFPATYGSTWSSSYTSDVNFTVSYASLYNYAQGIYISIVTEYDTVIGWGKMKVKMTNGNPSDSINVLQVKVNYQQMDSFFVAGSPANPTLMSNFGLAQGAITTSYEYRYIRPNEVTPLVDVFFVNSNYDHTNVNKTVVHMQRLNPDTTTSVQNIAGNNDILVYPNPLSTNTLFVDLQGMNDASSYQLVNMLGQVICRGSFAANTGKAQIQIPIGTSRGLYYLRLTNNNGASYTKPLNIL